MRDQYAARHHGLTPAVQFNDIAFALHALVLSTLTTSQYLLTRTLWRFEPAAGNRPSRTMLGVAAGCLLGVLATYLLTLSATPRDPATGWCELDVVYAVGYVKLLITLIKYTPQVLANARNRSTRGWSIWQVLLDLAGGVLSVAQLAIDSYLQRDWSGLTGNPVKLALGNISVLYDAIFMLQHYVLYRDRGEIRRKTGNPEDDGLLTDAERRED